MPTKQNPAAESPELIAYEVTRLLRPLSLGLRVLEKLQGAKGLATTTRAVLDLLHKAGPSTVPFLARALLTSRQPMQRAVDELLKRRLVVQRRNLAHRRSQLLEITEAGVAELDRFRLAEMRRLRSMVAPFRAAELATCARVLEHLRIEFALVARDQPRRARRR